MMEGETDHLPVTGESLRIRFVLKLFICYNCMPSLPFKSEINLKYELKQTVREVEMISD